MFVVDSQWDAEAAATTVELSCASSEEAVYWRKDSEGKQKGKTLSVAVKELPDAGNYSCVSEESHRVLSSSLLLIARIGPDGHLLRDILKSFKGTALQCWDCPAQLGAGSGNPWEMSSQRCSLQQLCWQQQENRPSCSSGQRS